MEARMMRICLSLLGAAAIALAAPAAQAQEAHAHIGHVMTGWGDTPDGGGLLPTAIAEAKIALQHADYAVSQPENLESIRLHTGHVMHAVDPGSVAGGPGLGYGLINAASGAAAHIGYAAGAADASDGVKVHAEHVTASARNVVTWSNEIMRLAEQVMTNDNPKHANIMAGRIGDLLVCIVNGCDANSDGTISWGPGEGGLAQAEAHMGYMMQGEGL
jgi:hypothetical protein